MHNSEKKRKPAKRRGPQPFKPTKRHRADVTLYAAGGMSEDGIAFQIGVCRNTLRQHFACELTAGHERAIAENLRRLRKAADGGNVTAMKHLDAKFGQVAAVRSFQQPSSDDASSTKPARLGKKEEAQIAAQTAGAESEWGNDLAVPGALPN